MRKIFEVFKYNEQVPNKAWKVIEPTVHCKYTREQHIHIYTSPFHIADLFRDPTFFFLGVFVFIYPFISCLLVTLFSMQLSLFSTFAPLALLVNPSLPLSQLYSVSVSVNYPRSRSGEFHVDIVSESHSYTLYRE